MSQFYQIYRQSKYELCFMISSFIENQYLSSVNVMIDFNTFE